MTSPARESLPLDGLCAELAAGAVAVTPTRRLARWLRLRFGAMQPSDSWATPAVLPWPAWVAATYRELRDFGHLDDLRPCLGEVQSTALWERVLGEDPEAGRLLMPGAAADGFREAWSLAREWHLPWEVLAARGGEDTEVFLRVAAAYRAALDESGFLDGAELPARVARAIDRAPDTRLLWVGFDFLTPAQASIAAVLGPRSRHLSLPPRQGVPVVRACEDVRQELAAATEWARARLDADPGARLGIVVPELESHASLVEDLLDAALAPARLWPEGDGLARPWNLSLGAPLADAPVVAAAFLAGELLQAPLRFETASRLLRSPFLGGADGEAAPRARAEAWLRQHAGERFAPGRWLAWLEGAEGAPACPRLAAGLRGFLGALAEGPRRRLPSAWAASLAAALRQLGWPGERAPDSAGWQTVQAWNELLEGFSGLDAVTGPLGEAEALARLRRQAAGQTFQPESPEVPVQVLGLLEATGLEFDGLWVSGLHDGVLPAPLRPCPLLPAALQRERRMPRACPAHELDLAHEMVARLAGAAQEVCFSHPRRRDDEPLRPSPLLAGFEASRESPVLATSVPARLFAARRLEWLVDERGPPAPREMRGGSGLLAAQSACPFQAFASYRLGAGQLETPVAGVDPRRRGEFTHLALRLLWAELRDQAGLAALDENARAEAVAAATTQAAAESLGGITPVLVAIEIEQARVVIGSLLSLELQRPAFEVDQREARVTLEVGPLRIRGRLDRVDRVAGGRVLIDYKTGQAHPGAWRGERPVEPQMPLYAAHLGGELAAVAYAVLKPGEVGFAGLAQGPEPLGPLLQARYQLAPEEWAAQLEDWRRAVNALAAAIGAGDARLDPLQPDGLNGSCARCHLATLCRRDQWLRDATPTAEDAGDD